MPQIRETLIEQLFDQMGAVKRGIQGHLQPLSRDFPISRAQMEMLFVIERSQPIGVNALSRQLCMTAGAVSQSAEGLEHQELIARETDALDRRKQYLRVSKKGNKLLADMEKRRRALMENVMRDLTNEELETWLHVQQKMLKHFQTEIDETNK